MHSFKALKKTDITFLLRLGMDSKQVPRGFCQPGAQGSWWTPSPRLLPAFVQERRETRRSGVFWVAESKYGKGEYPRAPGAPEPGHGRHPREFSRHARKKQTENRFGGFFWGLITNCTSEIAPGTPGEQFIVRISAGGGWLYVFVRGLWKNFYDPRNSRESLGLKPVHSNFRASSLGYFSFRGEPRCCVLDNRR